MEIIKPKNISKFIMILPIIGIFVTIILITTVTTYTIKHNFQKEKQQITKEFMHNLKITTKKRVELAYNIIDALYKNNQNDKDSYKKTIIILRKVLDKLRWDKKGYIFVFDYKGNTIYHINKKFLNQNRWNIKRNGVAIVKLIITSALAHPNGTYVKYLAYNPDGKPLEKISFVKVYKPLKIVIGNGVYLDYLDKKLLKKQKAKEQLLHELIQKIIIISIIILITMSIIMLYFSYKLKNLFKQYDTAINKEKQNLFQKANFDTLTGLHNRAHFLFELKEHINIARRENKQLFILFLDLDHFKEINDSLGHQYGDKVLKVVAKRLKQVLRNTDIIARFGGDEFAILLTHTHSDDVPYITNKILKKLKEPLLLKNNNYYISASIGISTFPQDSEKSLTLIKYADIAMYKSKAAGKDRFTFYNPEMLKEADKKLSIKNELFEAMKSQQFKLFFQPQIDSKNKLFGMETLIRWEHPTKGLLPPIEFIPHAIELGIIDSIDLWVIKQSIIQHKKWQKQGYNPGVISCNITMYQIEKNNFYKDLQKIINDLNFNPKFLNLEITEESLMKKTKKTIEVLNKITQLGVNINIDDFGTGYSSLSYLKKLPVKKLKIDRNFIKDIPHDKDDIILTKTIINLAKNLNLEIIAEGIETEIQKEFIFSNGADYIQGFYFSPPIDASEFEEKFLKDINGSK